MEFEQVQALVAEKAPPMSIEGEKEVVETETEEPENEGDAEPTEETEGDTAGEEDDSEEEADDGEEEESEGDDEDNDGDSEPEVVKTDKGRMVPYSVMKREKEERAAEREARIRTETELNMYRNAWQQMQTQQTAPVKEETNPFDPELEVVEHLKWENKQLSKKFETFTQTQNQMTEQQTHQAAVGNAFRSAGVLLEQATAEIPDAKAAMQHYIASKRKEYTRIYGEQQAEAMTETAVLQVIAPALQKGLSAVQFGRMMKELATEVAGYQQQKKKSSPDLEAIARNKKKSGSAGSGGSATVTTGTMDVKKAMKPGGRGVDLDEAMKIINRIGKGK